MQDGIDGPQGGVRVKKPDPRDSELLGNSLGHPGRSGGMAEWYRTPGIPSVAEMKRSAVA